MNPPTGPGTAQLVGSLPQGVIFQDLATAAREHESLVREHLHSLVLPSEWKLGALQAAAWQEGAFIYVPAGVEVELPLRYIVQHGGACCFHTR